MTGVSEGVIVDGGCKKIDGVAEGEVDTSEVEVAISENARMLFVAQRV